MRAAARALLLTLPLAVALFGGAGRAAAAPPKFRVIAHPDAPVAEVDRKFLADVFLKKITRWPDGTPVRPVDLTEDAEARRAFSDEVVARSVLAVKSYWQQSIFSGRDVPPPELEGDDAVVEFVRRTPGSIGYVSRSADVSRVRVLAVK